MYNINKFQKMRNREEPVVESPASGRTRRFRFACRVLATVFLLLGVARLANGAVMTADPILASTYFQCVEDCRIRTWPERYLGSEHARDRARARGATREAIAARLEDPSARGLLIAAEFARALPFAIMLLALAVAMRQMAARGLTGSTVRWLRRSAAAAIFWTLAQPLEQSLQWTAFSTILVGWETTHVTIGSEMLWPLLLAVLAWLSLRMLHEAVAIKEELGEYV